MVISDKISKGMKLYTQSVLISGLDHGLYKVPGWFDRQLPRSDCTCIAYM